MLLEGAHFKAVILCHHKPAVFAIFLSLFPVHFILHAMFHPNTKHGELVFHGEIQNSMNLQPSHLCLCLNCRYFGAGGIKIIHFVCIIPMSVCPVGLQMYQ